MHHDILKCLRIHAAFCHIWTERMPAHIRCYCRHLYFVNTIIRRTRRIPLWQKIWCRIKKTISPCLYARNKLPTARKRVCWSDPPLPMGKEIQRRIQIHFSCCHHGKKECLHIGRFLDFCKSQGIIQSMNKAGYPYDNAPMEGFYKTFKEELVYKGIGGCDRTIYVCLAQPCQTTFK